jgi:hypothetical protein
MPNCIIGCTGISSGNRPTYVSYCLGLLLFDISILSCCLLFHIAIVLGIIIGNKGLLYRD